MTRLAIPLLALSAVACGHVASRPDADACDSSHPHRCVELAARELDQPRALQLYEHGCDGGDMLACDRAGMLRESAGGAPADDSLAARDFARACSLGSAHACGALGSLYDSGRGVASDLERAFALYRQACDGGVADACEHLATMFATGRLVAQNIGRATALYKQACSAGDTPACASVRAPKTCVVLSVGGPKGVAHLGALDAIRTSGIKIDCVFGNSMGSLIGSLYASAPNEDLTTRYRGLIGAYKDETEKKKVTHSLLGLLIGAGLAVASGGTLGVAAIAGLGAGAVGFEHSRPLDDQRVATVMDAYLRHAQIETLPVPFATSYGYVSGGGLELQIATRGSLAEAISRSINNPYVFKGTALTYVDPGGDRASMVPVEDACRLFHPTRIIAVNVSGDPAYYRPLDCEVQEIVVPTGAMNEATQREAFSGQGEAFVRLYRAGYDAAKQALEARQPLPAQ